MPLNISAIGFFSLLILSQSRFHGKLKVGFISISAEVSAEKEGEKKEEEKMHCVFYGREEDKKRKKKRDNSEERKIENGRK